MKKSLLIALSFASAVAVAGPVVDQTTVEMKQPAGIGPVEISYVLSDAPAVITVDVQTNAGDGAWASIGDGNVRTLSGDVNRLVQPSAMPRKIVWKPHRDWPDHLIGGENTRAVVEVWPTNAPPEVMVIDLERGEPAFYRSEAAMPFAVTDDVCVTTKLVMRKMPAANARWQMGTATALIPKNDKGQSGDKVTGMQENQHYVAFNEDFYMAVYPITQGQYDVLKAKAPSFPSLRRVNVGDALPQAFLSHNACRGTAPAINWPLTGHAVDGKSILGCLRGYVGYGVEFDMPTEAQWEFACRAGTTGNWYYGDAYSEEHCWSGGKDKPCDVRYSRNPWGLYGMYGNCGNHCLDFKNTRGYDGSAYEARQPEIINPTGEAAAGADAGALRATRGGYYSLALDGANPSAVFCRSGARYRYITNGASDVWSLRLVAPCAIGGAK